MIMNDDFSFIFLNKIKMKIYMKMKLERKKTEENGADFITKA